jgi:YHS domain-containing protein
LEKIMNARTIDPVCGMEVDPRQYQTNYLGITYAFCSEQCQQRFLANPRLYVGAPGNPAPKQEGVIIIKKRRMRLAAPLDHDQARRVINSLNEMMGIRHANADGDIIEITYDLLEAGAALIEQRLATIGVQLGEGWSERLRRAFIHFEEECELENLAANDKNCCEARRW